MRALSLCDDNRSKRTSLGLAWTSLIPDSASSINPNIPLFLSWYTLAVHSHARISIYVSTREIIDNPRHFYDVKMADASFPTRHTLPRLRRSKSKTVIKITRVEGRERNRDATNWENVAEFMNRVVRSSFLGSDSDFIALYNEHATIFVTYRKIRLLNQISDYMYKKFC